MNNNNDLSEESKNEESEGENQESPKSFTKYIIIAILLGFFVAFSYLVFLYYIKSIPDIVVPDVIGLDKDIAIQILERNSLSPILGGSRFSQINTPDIILFTDPEQGRTVKAGRNIRYFVNMGEERITMPELKGLFIEQAQEIMSTFNISIATIDMKYSVEYREDTIMYATPNIGEYLNRHTTINVILSKGFPVDINFSQIQEGHNYLAVSISLHIPLDAETKKTNIKIISMSQESNSILFNEDIESGKELFFEFEDKIGNKIEVFYNDILARTSLVLL
jgi:hypothetical protein